MMSKEDRYREGVKYNLGMTVTATPHGLPEPKPPKIICPLQKGGISSGKECMGNKCAYFGEYVCMRVCVSPNIGKICPMPYGMECNENCGFYKRGDRRE
nr:MAG TPA: hypothetical protein [Caudoviricetes sp.]